MSRISIVIASAIVLSMTGIVYANPPDHSSANRAAIADIKRAAGKKGVALYDLNNQYTEFKQTRGNKARPVDFVQRSNMLPVADGYVTIDAIAEPGMAQQLRSNLEQIGLKNASVYKNVVSGRLPLESLESVDTAAGLDPAPIDTQITLAAHLLDTALSHMRKQAAQPAIQTLACIICDRLTQEPMSVASIARVMCRCSRRPPRRNLE